jgi:uncharacterized protein (TIGR02266 family)
MGRKKILLVDDVELFRALERTFFRREEFDLIEAKTGQQALDLALSEQPDLILMDLYMPEMDGDEACRRLKARPETAAIPVIMVTQAGRDAERARCQAAGCDDVVLKPINRAQFLEVSRRHLELVERVAERYPAKLEVCYGATADQKLTDFSVNISTGGLFLETAQPLPAGTPLTLQINLPNRSTPLRCSARVAWVNEPENPLKAALPPGVGLQFVDLSLEDMHQLRDFLIKELAGDAP